MNDRSDNAGQPAVGNAPGGPDNLPSSDELLHASEAAAEHTHTEPDAAQQAELDRLRNELAAANDKHLRLLAEFDNFRKRTARERTDLIQFAGENTLKNMLPVLDDMERAMQVNATAEDLATVKQGFALIHAKLVHILGAQGVKTMEDVKGAAFDVERHEAISKAAAPEPGLRGRVLEVVENGYLLNDKVIRYAKVVVGE
jgi:molecular chaperone GrpE